MGLLLAAIVAAAPIADLHFNDPQLQAIATELAAQARARGITATSGRNAIERLLALESSLGSSDRALRRANKLAADLMMSDSSQWARLRARTQSEFAGRNEAVAQRVSDFFVRWKREQLDIAFDFLSSNYSSKFIPPIEWEQRFHRFLIRRPFDAATWGWVVLRGYGRMTEQQYGHADSELAYRFYLESTGLGDQREARDVFSVPGIAIKSDSRRSN